MIFDAVIELEELILNKQDIEGIKPTCLKF